MALSTRIRRHIQSNVVGYLALFVALSGTALALPGKGSVKSKDIAKAAVKGKALAPNAVSRSKLRANAVDASKIAAASVTAAKLGAGAVTNPAIADGAVTSTKLANGAVIREKIGQGEINGGKLANGAINSAKVADGTLLAEDFADGQISDGFAAIDNEPPFGTENVVGFTTFNYNAPRAGRLLITATMTAGVSCTLQCEVTVAVFLDGNRVPGSTRILDSGSGNYFVTSTSLASVGAGAHTLQIRKSTDNDDTIGLENQAISGILLQ